MRIEQLKIKFFLVALCGFFLTSVAFAEPISMFIDKAIWGIHSGPLELSGICHVASNEYACVSDSGGRVYSFFFNHDKIDTPGYMPTAENFVLIKEGLGHDLESCIYADGAILCIDESTSSIKGFYLNKKDWISIKLPVKNVVSNCGLESLAYFPNNQLFVTCTEQAIHGAPNGQVKLIFFTLDLKNKTYSIKAEIPYQIDVFCGEKVYRNGVSELLAWDDETLLVIERAIDMGRMIPHSRIRIYALKVKIDYSQNGIVTMKSDKKLVYEYDSKIAPANVEGICRIPNTKDLLFVHDLHGICSLGVLIWEME